MLVFVWPHDRNGTYQILAIQAVLLASIANLAWAAPGAQRCPTAALAMEGLEHVPRAGSPPDEVSSASPGRAHAMAACSAPSAFHESVTQSRST